MIQEITSKNIKIDVLSGLMKDSIKNRIPFIIRNFYEPMFDWNFGIEFLNKCMIEKEEDEFITKIGDYYFILQPNYKLNSLYSDYYNIINQAHPEGVIGIPVILVSIFNNVPNLNEHADPLDQMHLAISGNSNWKITLDDGSIENHILSPGDFIFLPVLIKHEVKSINHRIGLTFSANRTY